MNDKPDLAGAQVFTFKPEGMEWALIVPISGGLEGGIEDWPSHIQDPIYEALQKAVEQARMTGELAPHITTVEIIMSRCGYDFEEDFHFIHVIAAARHYKVQNHRVLKQGRKSN